ncbi:MAG: DNA-binding transcriptional LysR family regulator [Gammaproteobacteria bacterium]|jgi:DNA-binding transcriptional LysR family regulator
MKLRELELLHSLMSYGSVSDAARALHMSQPNASKMLKKIEEGVGFLLFERINSRLHATEEARLIFDQVESTLLSLRRFQSLTEDIRDMHRGSLTLGGLPLLSRYWLPDVLSRFMQKHPRINTTFHTRSSKKLIELVAERQLDVAISMLSIDDPLVECSVLSSLEFVAAIPLNHALAKKPVIQAEDLHLQDFVSLSVLDHTREEIESCLRNAGAVPNERSECSLPSVVLQMVENGIGIGLVDDVSANEHQPRNIVFRPFQPTVRVKVWLMRPRMRPRSMVVDEFVELLIQTVESQGLSLQNGYPV